LVPTFDGGDDFVGVCIPCEGIRLCIVFDDEAIDGSLQVDDRDEHAALQASFGEFGEEAFDSVELGARCRREVESKALAPVEPCANLRALMRGVVVENDMNRFPAGSGIS
jgi:hypothetical protein